MDDYDHEPKATPGLFLRLRQKDESFKVRIASRPYRTPQIWKKDVRGPMADDKMAELDEVAWATIMSNPDYEVKENYCWKVIDRADGKARILQAAPSVYKNIKDLAKNEDWGDPQSYDIKVARTEVPGNYYTVMPLPDKTPLTPTEIDDIKKLDLAKLMPGARITTDKQIDDISDYISKSATTTDDEEINSLIPPEDLDEVVDVPDGPINLNDLFPDERNK